MIRLIYESKTEHLISDAELKKILEHSQRNNPAKGVTGVLVYGGGAFMQYLEGPEAAVLELYLKILHDRRHTSCELVYISATNQRLFEDWSMGLIKCGPLDMQNFLDFKYRGIDTIPPKVFTELIREFVTKLNET